MQAYANISNKLRSYQIQSLLNHLAAQSSSRSNRNLIHAGQQLQVETSGYRDIE